MHLEAYHNSVIIIMAMGLPRVTFWPLTLMLFSVTAMVSGCKPAKPSEPFNPTCASNT